MKISFPALRRLPGRCLLGLLLPVLAGCAATTTFVPYPARIAPLVDDLRLKRPVDLGQCLADERRGEDAVLYAMERGRAALITGQYDASLAEFNASAQRIREHDERAVISASAVGAQVVATVVNDNAIPYDGYGYERVMLHHFLALDYLGRNDPEGAGVEARLANFEQERAAKRLDEELARARQEGEENRVGAALGDERLAAVSAGMDGISARVRNSFQNAYTFYLSGFIYELLDQPNDAFIDYRRALEIYPENSYVQRDAVRLAAALGMGEEFDRLAARFGIDRAEPLTDDDGADLLVLFEDGLVPPKQEVKIPLPVPRVGIVAIAFPVYGDRPPPGAPLTLAMDGKPLGRTEPICDFRALAAKALQEKAPAIVTRQVMRAVAKGATARVATDQLGAAGLLLSSIWNYMSESADLRSWLTLPADAQVMRVRVPAGTHRLALKHEAVPAPAFVDLAVGEAARSVIHVVRVGGQLYTNVFNL
jgi:hypothetical protein